MTAPAVPADLTERQHRIVEYVRTYTAEHGRSPSLREIATAAGLRASSSAEYQLRRLERLGVISRGEPGTVRRIVPVFGGCCGVCGQPMPARE